MVAMGDGSTSGRRARWIGLVFVIGLFMGCAERVPPPASAELDDAVGFLRAVHPAPHRYLSAVDLEARLDAAKRRLGSRTDPTAFARELLRITSAFGDAHLLVGRKDELSEAEPVRLPLVIKRAGGRFFVDASSPAVPIGTEVVSVEGVPIAELVERLADMVSVDGMQPDVRMAVAERRFAALASLELGMRSRYRLTLRLPEAQHPTTVTWSGVDLNALVELTQKRHSTPVLGGDPAQDKWPALRPGPAGSMLLRLGSFGNPERDAYVERVDAAFASLPPDRPLILDLRGNGGGDRVLGTSVLRHLLDVPFRQWSRVGTKLRDIPEPYDDRVTFHLVPQDYLVNFPGMPRGGGFVFEGDPKASFMTPHEHQHRGPITVFIDDATNSAAVEMLAALLAHREGVRVLGTTTRGGCDRHIGEIPILFETLSGHFAIVVSLADIEMVPVPGCRPGHGIEPTERVAFTERDFLDARDPFFDAY